ncbi:MAG: hypothetical protein A2516_11240 [Alphaproteobacteria bacterium RIFOXYD12_FULL_60_8]|nr:MAG: hypothetical protein A2516_11240 [Alphaproteobacteria bacterium RIFOXYD12_FULL_60_8]
MVPTMELTNESTQQRLALAWGFAEAIVWPFAPEVVASYVAATKGPLPAVRVVGFLLAGMAAGAVVAYALGVFAYAPMLAFYELMPLIGPGVLENAHENLRVDDVFGIVFNHLGGTPTRASTIHAASLEINLLAYLFIFLFVAAVRLLVATGITLTLSATLGKSWSEARRGKVALAAWGVLYAFFAVTWLLGN